MCVILDTNRFGDVLKYPADPRYVPLLGWLLSGEGMLVYGGTEYGEEIARHGEAVSFFARCNRAGHAHLMDKGTVDREAERLKAKDLLRSNDGHIIALARMSGARTVCTEDKDLMTDVKNSHLLTRPKGRIYRDTNHARLLRHDRGCRRPPSRRK